MPVALLMKDWLLLRDHRYLEAEGFTEQLSQLAAERRLHPGWIDFGREWLEYEKSVAIKADQKQIDAALERLVDQARGEAPPWPRWEIVTGNVVPIQAANDSPESAIQTLAIRADKGILEPYDWLLLNPELQPIRSDTRFQQIASRSKVQFEEMLSILEEARSRNELPAYLEKSLTQLRARLAQ
jgi:hypothetical protein